MPKQVQDDNAIIKETYNAEDNMQGDIVQVERKEMQNLHDSLVQLGRENEQLKGTIREWIVKTENMDDEIKKGEDRNKDISKELKELKVVLNTPVLGIAGPVKNSDGQLGYDCYLCDQKGMNQNGMYNHLKQMHNVKQSSDTIPVEENNQNVEKRSVVTTKETTAEVITNNANSTISTDSSEAQMEFAHYCDKCKKGFTHKANLYKHKKEHSVASQSNSNAPIVEKTIQPSNTHRNFKFSGIITCNTCEAVFISQLLLKQHNDKYHKEGPEPVTETNDALTTTPQLHCALYEDTTCQFQCESLGEMNNHIEKNT